MKGRVCDRLRMIADQRERAYLACRYGKMDKLRAISRIRNVANYFSCYDETRQLRAVIALETDLKTITPSAASRFHGVRKKIQQLINEAYEIHPRSF